jgi:hypothetical protein
MRGSSFTQTQIAWSLSPLVVGRNGAVGMRHPRAREGNRRSTPFSITKTMVPLRLSCPGVTWCWVGTRVLAYANEEVLLSEKNRSIVAEPILDKKKTELHPLNVCSAWMGQTTVY